MTVGPRRYHRCMDGMTTAQDLDAMTPDERIDAVRAGFVTVPDALPEGVQEFRRQKDAERDLRAQRAS